MVDMFWAPLRWILPIAGCEAWLLLRWFPPSWLVGPPGFPFDAQQYARVVAIEPLASGVFTHTIDPVVLVNEDEQRPRGSLRARLGVSDRERLVGVLHAGEPGEAGGLVAAASARDGERVATFDLHAADALFPAAEWLGDCDHVHAAAGYNSFWESRWLGWHARTTVHPIARRNDDQAARAARFARVPMRSNGADTLASWILRG